MSNYTKITDFASKDSLATGNPLKLIKGTEINDEYNAIQTAIGTKADLASPAFTGNPTATTQAPGNNSTRLATTGFVQEIVGNLGTMSTQDADAVAITGGTITGLSSPLPVASGGTGLATLTANNVVLGNGTSAPSFVAPSTNGNVLMSNGTTWISQSFTGVNNIQVFTSSGTFTVPSGIFKVKVTVVGAGGNGAGSTLNAQPLGVGGGGAGGVAIKICTVTPAQAITVTVGGAGTTSVFTGFCQATSGGNATIDSDAGGAGGVGTGGDLNLTGQSGFRANGNTSGAGGTSFYGSSGSSVDSSIGIIINGVAAVGYGAGGGGAYDNTTVSSSTGGAGAGGLVIVEW